jgi:peptidoglycan/xylan/chitin deacetylase (PgdA/CDA1 family)
VLPGRGDPPDLQDVRQREQLAATLVEEARTLSGDHEAQQAWLGQLAMRLEIDWESIIRSRILHLMTRAEVADIARRGFDIQLHTHRHRTPRDKSAFCHEVLENRQIIEELTGRPATHFCYPSGDVDPIFLLWLRDLGVKTATTCSVDLAKAKHDRLLLPRYVDTMLQSEVLFESWLSGAAAMLSRRGT